MKKGQKGFTLIELLLVIAIIGILAAIAVPRFTPMTDKANEKACLQNLAVINDAIDRAKIDNANFTLGDAATMASLNVALFSTGQTVDGKTVKYLKTEAKDCPDGSSAYTITDDVVACPTHK